jgi:hypothetical protein
MNTFGMRRKRTLKSMYACQSMHALSVVRTDRKQRRLAYIQQALQSLRNRTQSHNINTSGLASPAENSNFLPTAMITSMSGLTASAGPLLGMVLIFGSLLCLGTFPTVLRLCTAYTSMDGAFPKGDTMKEQQKMTPKERFGQARHPCHVYLDFTVSYVVLTAVVFPVITSLFSGTGSNSQLQTGVSTMLKLTSYFNMMWKDLPLIAIVIMAGSLLALGNLSQQWSTAAFHAPLTTVLAIQAFLCVIVGTYWNYTLQPSRTSRPQLLMIGVIMFLAAIVCSVYAQSIYQMERDTCAKKGEEAIEHDLEGHEEDADVSSVVDTTSRTESLGLSLHDYTTTSPVIGSRSKGRLSKYGSFNESATACSEETSPLSGDIRSLTATAGRDLPSGPSDSAQKKMMTSDHTTSSSSHSRNDKIGIVVAVVGGLAFGFFSHVQHCCE